MKPERWGSLLVQEKYREEKACDKRHPYRIMIIDVAIPADRNVVQKEAQNKLKYKSLNMYRDTMNVEP